MDCVEENHKEKPELVKTTSGFSVFYKNKYLYSKRDPKKLILNLSKNIEIQPQSLIICASPVLGYGIKELVLKLPKNSILIAIEFDKTLFKFSVENLKKNEPDLFLNSNFFYENIDQISDFLKKIEMIILQNNIRRVIKINCSAGVNFNNNFYETLTQVTQEFISRYWINRLTLIEFGRNYARNLFKNFFKVLQTLERRRRKKNTENLFVFIKQHSVNKPVLVLGAGPSLDYCVDFIKDNRDKFFIIAVDAALGIYPKIVPDAIAVLESQYWIQRAFIGLANSKIPLLMDLTTNPRITKTTSGAIAFFYTEYTKNSFFSRLKEKKLLPISLEPMGSIGLTALSLAEKLAAEGVPVFHTGLDFSWGRGFSHSKMSYQIKEKLASSTKLNNLYSSFNPSIKSYEKIKGKNNWEVFTTANLKSYAELYKALFRKKTNFYDIGKTGIPISDNTIDLIEAKKILQFFFGLKNKPKKPNINTSQIFEKSYSDKTLEILDFFKKEKNKLTKLKNMFTGKKEFKEEAVLKLLKELPYLYLHFPDYSTQPKLEKKILNRIRIEIEYFLKIMP